MLNELFLGQDWKALPEDEYKYPTAVLVKYRYNNHPWKHSITRAVGGERVAVTIAPTEPQSRFLFNRFAHSAGPHWVSLVLYIGVFVASEKKEE